MTASNSVIPETPADRPCRGLGLARFPGTFSDADDTPTASGVRLAPGAGDFSGRPLMALHGEALHAMVSNLGQTDASYLTVDSTSSNVASQGFTTGSVLEGYRLQGIGVNIEGSNSEFPDSAESVTVSLYRADASGKPGDRLFDLVSPAGYKAGHHFFEAPPDTWLAAKTTYVMAWTHNSGTKHRLRRTLSDNEDSGKLTGFGIANAFASGADIDNLAFTTAGHSLEIAVYGEALGEDSEPLNQMVSNLRQASVADNYLELDSTTKVGTQAFTTGTYELGYEFQGVGINIEGSELMSAAQIPDSASTVSVSVYPADADGKPKQGKKLFDLESPSSFAAGAEHFFAAPPNATLAANKTYTVVWKYNSGTNHRLQRTASDNEDSNALADFSIADVFHWGAEIGNLSVASLDHALQIAVYGDYRRLVRGGYQVTPDWLHIPDGAQVGDQFRLLYVSKGLIDATSGDVEVYNQFVQDLAAFDYNDRIIRSVAPEFKAVVCTASVNARANTGMTDAQGVPVHWLDGGWYDRPTLIAKSYEQFYTADWTNRNWGAYVFGNSTELSPKRRFWTGCDARGVAHPTAHMGTTSPMKMVAVGTPGHTNAMFAPLGAVDVDSGYVGVDIGRGLGLYAISPIFTVVNQR